MSVERLFVAKGVKANLLWMLLEMSFRLINGLFIGLWLARYLGPENFGYLSYILGVILLLTPLSSWGLDVFLVRLLVSSEFKRNELLGTALLFRFGFGSLMALLVFLLAWIFDPSLIITWSVLGLILPLGMAKVFEFCLHGEKRYREVATVGVVSLVISATLKVVIIWHGFGLNTLAVAFLAEWVIGLTFYLVIFCRSGNKFSSLVWSRPVAQYFAKNGFFLMLSSVMIVLYMKTDVLMLKLLLGDHSAGVYSASSKILEGLILFPQLLVIVTFPELVSAWDRDKKTFRSKFKKMIVLSFLGTIILTVIMLLWSQDAILVFLGESYSSMTSVFAIHILCFFPMFCSLLWSRIQILQGEHSGQLVRNLWGAVMNILLNLLLIPTIGLAGAAWSSLISYLFLGCGYPFLSKSGRGILIGLFERNRTV
jgi:O-antigen/teichoic acid export membrane protein